MPRIFDFIEADQAVLSVGQITSDFQKSCQAPEAKIFRFTFLEIRIISHAVSAHTRGASRSSRNVGLWDAMDAVGVRLVPLPGEDAEVAYGEVVWSWGRDRGVYLRLNPSRSGFGQR